MLNCSPVQAVFGNSTVSRPARLGPVPQVSEYRRWSQSRIQDRIVIALRQLAGSIEAACQAKNLIGVDSRPVDGSNASNRHVPPFDHQFVRQKRRRQRAARSADIEKRRIRAAQERFLCPILSDVAATTRARPEWDPGRMRSRPRCRRAGSMMIAGMGRISLCDQGPFGDVAVARSRGNRGAP